MNLFKTHETPDFRPEMPQTLSVCTRQGLVMKTVWKVTLVKKTNNGNQIDFCCRQDTLCVHNIPPQKKLA